MFTSNCIATIALVISLINVESANINYIKIMMIMAIVFFNAGLYVIVKIFGATNSWKVHIRNVINIREDEIKSGPIKNKRDELPTKTKIHKNV